MASESATEVDTTPSALLRGGIATGVGSWPGTDPREAATTVVGELTDLTHLVELPDRGAGADMVGRMSAVLVDLLFETTPRGYRLAARPGALSRRARDLLRADLDVLEEVWETSGSVGTDRVLKVQACGPLTLAARVELPGGHRALTDHGAVRDISESLAEGLARHVEEIGKRLGARVVVQVDEPSVNDVLAGSLRGVSVLDTVPAVPAPEALAVLEAVIEAQSAPVVVHSCAAPPALEFLRRTSAAAIGFDMAAVGTRDLDHIGEIVDAGKYLVLGLVPTSEPAIPVTWREIAEPGVRLVDRLGFARATLGRSVIVAPACGLAGAPLSWARRALALVDEVARAYADEPESLHFD
ncbi:methionine synthase [Nocardia arizonensis]|uniref:methionine synthase n=1 Tax=Nocardia arizonensis TaxID=1141647 RepID=UPI000B259609|nr:methionine synthase [Nocardia arizonensis]